MHAAHNAVRNCRPEVGRQQERVADHVGPIADFELIAVPQLGCGKIVAAEELHHRHVAGRVDTDENGVIEHAVVEPALHKRAGPVNNVKVREGVTVGADEDARAASVTG
jgi:hypothetical protein